MSENTLKESKNEQKKLADIGNRGIIVSNHFKLFLIMVSAPFFVFWSLQVGEIAGSLVFSETPAPFTLWPDHFAWFFSGGTLGGLALLVGLLDTAAAATGYHP